MNAHDGEGDGADGIDHSLPIESPEYSAGLDLVRSVRKSLNSFRELYDRHLEAMKWLSAFALAGLLSLSTLSGAFAAAFVARLCLVFAGISYLASVIAALVFYARFLEANGFIHSAETRLNELEIATSRVSGRSAERIPRTEIDRINAAIDSVRELSWPQSVQNRGDQRAWRVCLAGFTLGTTTVATIGLVALITG